MRQVDGVSMSVAAEACERDRLGVGGVGFIRECVPESDELYAGSAIVWWAGRPRVYWGFGDEVHCGVVETHVNLKVLFRRLVASSGGRVASKSYGFDAYPVSQKRPNFSQLRRYGNMLYILEDWGNRVRLIPQPCPCDCWAPVSVGFECEGCHRCLTREEFDGEFKRGVVEFIVPPRPLDPDSPPDTAFRVRVRAGGSDE